VEELRPDAGTLSAPRNAGPLADIPITCEADAIGRDCAAIAYAAQEDAARDRLVAAAKEVKLPEYLCNLRRSGDRREQHEAGQDQGATKAREQLLPFISKMASWLHWRT